MGPATSLDKFKFASRALGVSSDAICVFKKLLLLLGNDNERNMRILALFCIGGVGKNAAV